MGVKNSLLAIPTQAFNTATLDAMNFQAVALPFPQAISFLKLVNTSVNDIEISYDGTTVNDVVTASEEVYSIAAASLGIPQNRECLFKKGTVVYARGTPSAGALYVIGYYQPH